MKTLKDTVPHALYIHIPFCAQKCRYCDFNSFVSESTFIDKYLTALEKEIVGLKGQYVFNTVYIGGGTPSILTELQLEKLLRSVLNNAIPVSETYEYTVEANPGTMNIDKAKVLKEYGVNRISMGVQLFQDRQLKLLGRIHSGDDARKTFDLLRNTGFKNINIDLIFGCSNQSHADWEEDLKTVIELNPEHISTYSLTYEEGTPLTRDLDNKIICKLDEDAELEMYKTTIRSLMRHDYHHYEISNFSRDGFQCAHNLNYWQNMGYVGVGAGAYSFINGIRSANEKDVLKYIEGIHENKSIKTFHECLGQDQRAAETIIMALRLRQGISNADFYERFGYTIEEQFSEQIDRFRRDGFITYDNKRLKITQKGLYIADTIMSEFV